jgi:hypothetical protein
VQIREISVFNHLSRRSPATAGRRRINSQLSTINSPQLLNHFLKLRPEYIHGSVGVKIASEQ